MRRCLTSRLFGSLSSPILSPPTSLSFTGTSVSRKSESSVCTAVVVWVTTPSYPADNLSACELTRVCTTFRSVGFLITEAKRFAVLLSCIEVDLFSSPTLLTVFWKLFFNSLSSGLLTFSAAALFIFYTFPASSMTFSTRTRKFVLRNVDYDLSRVCTLYPNLFDDCYSSVNVTVLLFSYIWVRRKGLFSTITGLAFTIVKCCKFCCLLENLMRRLEATRRPEPLLFAALDPYVPLGIDIYVSLPSRIPCLVTTSSTNTIFYTLPDCCYCWVRSADCRVLELDTGAARTLMA